MLTSEQVDNIRRKALAHEPGVMNIPTSDVIALTDTILDAWSRVDRLEREIEWVADSMPTDWGDLLEGMDDDEDGEAEDAGLPE